ncbi:MAG: response regulator [bacterium]
MRNKQMILVVDDDPDCIEFARVTLSPRYEVRTALSTKQCRLELQARKPDLILLDVMMAHLCEGLDMTRELKENAATRDIPVIMLTSVNETYDYSTQIEKSFFPHDRWLDKPVQPEVLMKAVQDVLGDSDGE